MSATADTTDDLKRAERVVGDHLERVAERREALDVQWTAAEEASR